MNVAGAWPCVEAARRFPCGYLLRSAGVEHGGEARDRLPDHRPARRSAERPGDLDDAVGRGRRSTPRRMGRRRRVRRRNCPPVAPFSGLHASLEVVVKSADERWAELGEASSSRPISTAGCAPRHGSACSRSDDLRAPSQVPLFSCSPAPAMRLRQLAGFRASRCSHLRGRTAVEALDAHTTGSLAYADYACRSPWIARALLPRDRGRPDRLSWSGVARQSPPSVAARPTQVAGSVGPA